MRGIRSCRLAFRRGVVDLVAAALLFTRGLATIAERSYSLEATRETFHQHVIWGKDVGS